MSWFFRLILIQGTIIIEGAVIGMKPVERSEWVGPMLQIFDSAFPVGSYAHSFGLEGMVQLGEVQDFSDLKGFVENIVFSSLSKVDLPLLRLAYEAHQQEQYFKLTSLDELSQATKATIALRETGGGIGKQSYGVCLGVCFMAAMHCLKSIIS